MFKNQQLAEAFKAYLQAHKELSRLWGDGEYGGNFARLYPFHQSFDELTHGVEIWAEDAITRLEANNVEDENSCHIHSTKDASCPLCSPATESTKKFMWKDKSGRGMNSNDVSLMMLFDTTSEDEQNWDGTPLHEWALEASEGEEWENSTDKWICTEG